MRTIKYDDVNVLDEKIELLSKVIQKIVREATLIDDVFVYAESPKIKIDVAPIGVFIEISKSKVLNKEEFFENIKQRISLWKKENGFLYPINLTLTPVDWVFETGII